MDKENHKGVWIFAEQREGVLQKISLELLGKGREARDTLNGRKLFGKRFGPQSCSKTFNRNDSRLHRP